MINTITANELFALVLHIVMAYGHICVLCFFGQSLCDNFDKLNDSILSCEWYKFPIRLQRHLNLMRAAAQYPVVIRGFGSSTCTRESLQEV